MQRYARENAKGASLRSLPAVQTKRKWTKKIRPGISAFAENPDRVGPDHLAELLDHARDVIPKDSVDETPFFLLATAGMRLLPSSQQEELLQQICSYVQWETYFHLPECERSIQIIDGPTEGLYGWLATNYLLGSFDDAAAQSGADSSANQTYGFLDMGGASAQIAFAPSAAEAEKHANDLTLLRLRALNGASVEQRLFTTSWLGYGVHQARDRYLTALLRDRPADEATQKMTDPCLPRGYEGEHVDIAIPSSNSTNGTGHDQSHKSPLRLVGTGDYDGCLRATYPLLEKNAPCPDQPCLVHGVHVPEIDFNANHFIGISEWWHTSHQILGTEHKDGDEHYDYVKYQERLRDFCSTPWDRIKEGVEEHKYGKKVDVQEASEICFKASWLVNLLHEGIGVPRIGLDDGSGNSTQPTPSPDDASSDAFKALDKIGSTEISWTLGKALLFASSDVPTQDPLPVGFGSNVPGVPDDFRTPGPSAKYVGVHYDKHWHDLLFSVDSSRRIPGFVLFVVIILIAGFYMFGKERRARFVERYIRSSEGRVAPRLGRGWLSGTKFARMPFFTRGFFSPASIHPEYERMLEEGAREFELGDIDHGDDYATAAQAVPGSSAAAASAAPQPQFTVFRPQVTPPGLPSGSRPTQVLHEASARSSISSSPGHDPRADIDRRGLVVKTESSEHVPSSLSIGSTNTGRRSRGASPIRRASSRSPPR
ncbi:Golgi apyrase [Ascosphaera acerosa]|nr:Golgi apyrase [Ascosphaera acerosa]